MTKVEFLKAFSSACKIMTENAINAAAVKYLQLFADYERMRSEGQKYSFIVYYLAQQYEVNESTIFRIVKRLKEPIKQV